MIIINVYAPCAISEKELLWDTIKLILAQNEESRICVMGDFNSIRISDERIGSGGEANRRDIQLFDDFIMTSGLFDLPLQGRKFTWYKPDGTCKSKLDRILVNEEWLRWRPDLKLKSLGRSFSDHCPLFLKTSIVDWGPKPFKFFNVLITHPDFKDFCIWNWQSYNVQGWKSFILKEKLKMMKTYLKRWSHKTFGALNQEMEEQRGTIDKLDRFDKVFGLEEEEIIERNRVTAELKRNLIWNESFLSQKAKTRWIKEWDVNSSFFHGWINKRPKINGIEGLMINEELVESKDGVRTAIFNHFREQFKYTRKPRVLLPADICKKKLDQSDNTALTAPFSKEEIKAAIWGCKANKSPGLDGFNFTFFKEFWEKIKLEIQQMMDEFHSNGRFTKEINSTFIVLIPKKENC
ncbi:hypothetical protein ACS0TY_006859 [Phlomoides rotata]